MKEVSLILKDGQKPIFRTIKVPHENNPPYDNLMLQSDHHLQTLEQFDNCKASTIQCPNDSLKTSTIPKLVIEAEQPKQSMFGKMISILNCKTTNNTDNLKEKDLRGNTLMHIDNHSKTPKHGVPGLLNNDQNNLFGDDKPEKYVIESDGEQISFSEIPAHQNPCVPDITYTQSQVTDIN